MLGARLFWAEGGGDLRSLRVSQATALPRGNGGPDAQRAEQRAEHPAERLAAASATHRERQARERRVVRLWRFVFKRRYFPTVQVRVPWNYRIF